LDIQVAIDRDSGSFDRTGLFLLQALCDFRDRFLQLEEGLGESFKIHMVFLVFNPCCVEGLSMVLEGIEQNEWLIH